MTEMMKRATGSDGRLFAEAQASPDETSFRIENTSEAYYDSPYYKKHKEDLQKVPSPRVDPPRMDLGDVLDDDVLKPLVDAKRVSFHAVGDTGAAKVNRSQKMATAISHEAGVADLMAKGVEEAGEQAPAFFFHLGDVVYNFGEGQYYYDQFYEPFRDYDRPIFAVPGNHDGMVFGSSPDTPSVKSLTAFLRNFCAEAPGPAEDAAGLMRSTMNQPGVYFTLDAPFVSIVGLYTNVLDGPGVLSTQGGHYPDAGGFSETAPRTHFDPPVTNGKYTLVADPIVHFGYLTVTVDMNDGKQLEIAYRPSDPEVKGDSVRVDLKTGKLAR